MFISIGSDWPISGVYLLSALLCVVAWVAAERRREELTAPGRYVWLLLALGLAAIATLQLFDVQQLVADKGRGAARSEGLYVTRRDIQAAIIVIVVLGLGVMVAYGALVIRGKSYGLSLVAAVSLGGFLTVRAISLHQIDSLLYGQTVAGVAWNDLIESALALFVGFGAVHSQGVRPSLQTLLGRLPR